MNKIKVIFRKNKDGDIIAFFPETHAIYGNIMTYMHIGQHGEGSYEFYTTTEKANEEEYKDLLSELRQIYNDCKLVVKQKLHYNDLTDKAWKCKL